MSGFVSLNERWSVRKLRRDLTDEQDGLYRIDDRNRGETWNETFIGYYDREALVWLRDEIDRELKAMRHE